jgi:hypothetical protein
VVVLVLVVVLDGSEGVLVYMSVEGGKGRERVN